MGALRLCVDRFGQSDWTRIVGLVVSTHQQEVVMSKNRQLLSLGIVIVFVAAGFFVGRSQAQARKTPTCRLAVLMETRRNAF